MNFLFFAVDLYQSNDDEYSLNLQSFEFKKISSQIVYELDVLFFSLQAKRVDSVHQRRWSRRILEHQERLKELLGVFQDKIKYSQFEALELNEEKAISIAELTLSAINKKEIELRQFVEIQSLIKLFIELVGLEPSIYIKMLSLKDKILVLDESLTMAAYLAAFSGEISWKSKYQIYEKRLDYTLEEALDVVPNVEYKNDIQSIYHANISLVDMEKRSFSFVESGQIQRAQVIFLSSKYELQKNRYASGILNITAYLQEASEKYFEESKEKIFLYLLLIIVLSILFILITFWLIRYVFFWERKFTYLNDSLLEEVKSSKNVKYIIDELISPILVTDEEGVIRFVSKNFCKLLDLTSEDLTFKNIRDIAVNPDSLKQALKPEFKTQKELEVNFYTSFGTIIPFSIDCKAIKKSKQIIGLLFKAEDLRSKKAEENRIRKIELQKIHSKKLEMVGTLAGGIAHDFNNYLVPIITFSELIKSRLSPEFKEYDEINKILKSAKKAKDLVSQILIFSKKKLPTRESLSIRELVEESILLLSSYQEKNIEIETEFSIGRDEEIFADGSQISQVVVNLAINAIQSSNVGSKIILRLFRCTKDGFDFFENSLQGSFLVFEVEDFGAGIPEEMKEHIFEPYFSYGKRNGVGLGLSVVISIIESHNAQIQLKSFPEQGTRFTVFFPIR